MRRPDVGFFALAMLAAACTVPTEMPNWDIQWNLPVNVNDLGIDISTLPLPSGVTIDSTTAVPAVRTGFTAQVSSLPAIVRTLGAQCADASCQSATNVSSPKPAFNAPPATSNLTLAAGTNLQTAVLLPASKIVIDVANNFGFDPLNPPGGDPGTITLVVNNGAATLGTLTLQGPGNTLPAGATRTFTIDLVGTVNTTSAITVTMTMDSPEGDPAQPVTLNRNQTFTVTSTPTIKISTATVAIAANAITPSTTNMDLAELSEMSLRVEGVSTDQGALLLTVTNPMSLGANASLTFTGTKQLDDVNRTRPMTTITKNVSLPVGGGANTTTTITVPFTGVELREMLGSNMNVTFAGSTIAGTTAVTPTSKISTAGRMRLRIFVKEIEQ
jgi:hypothetical protein